tara:strand:- start:5234 stop:5932 length:699 start_codon:yes stop_codon:yes gene_type:complete
LKPYFNAKFNVLLKNILLFLSLVCFVSCSSLKYKSSKEVKLPSLTTIGNFENYLLQDYEDPLTMLKSADPVRLKAERVRVTETLNFLKNNDQRIKDSIVLSLTIIDKIALLEAINNDKTLLNYLQNSKRHEIVHQVTVNISSQMRENFLEAEDLFLSLEQGKAMIEIQNGAEKNRIHLSELAVLDFQTLSFCWGTPKGYKVVVMNLISENMECSSGSYSNYKRAKKKTKFDF